MIKQHLFVIGAPRSGTTWLQIMLAAHPRVCTTVELTLYNHYTMPWLKTWQNEVTALQEEERYRGLAFIWTERQFYDFLRHFIEAVYQTLAAKNPHATHILDKNPEYSQYVEHINHLLPTARFIHLIRDGRDVAVSVMAAKKTLGFGQANIQEAASYWHQQVLGARQGRQYAERYLEVRYEHLLNDGVNTLQTVFDFCELPFKRDEIAAIVENHRFEAMKTRQQGPDEQLKSKPGYYRRGKIGSWRQELSPLQKYIFQQVAGDLLKDLGYAEDDWWATSPLHKIGLPFLAQGPRLSQTIRQHIHHLRSVFRG